MEMFNLRLRSFAHGLRPHRAPAVKISVLVPQALLLARAPHALRWRLETFGLYMPSLPEARP